jgi:hypothetical protein
MSRTVPAALLTALAQKEVQPFYGVEMLFDGGAVRLWTGYGNRTINGETYTGAGSLLNIEGLAEVADLSAKAITISLSGVPAELVSLSLQEPYQRRRCKVFFGAVEVFKVEDYGLISDAATETDDWDSIASTPIFFEDYGFLIFGEGLFVEVFSGQINTMPIEDSGETSVITATVDSKLVETEKASNLRYTSEGQKSRYSGDTFFDYVSAIQDAEIVWGRKSA